MYFDDAHTKSVEDSTLHADALASLLTTALPSETFSVADTSSLLPKAYKSEMHSFIDRKI